MPAVTLSQVADYLGLNKSTVSRALKGNKKIPLETRKRILKAARELGYHEDPSISKLMGQLRNGRGVRNYGTLAAVRVTEKKKIQRDMNNPGHKSYLNGLCKQSRKQGYQVDCFWGDGSPDSYEQIFNELKLRGIEGVIFLHLTQQSATHIPLPTDFFAGVYIGGGSHLPSFHRVDFDHRENVFLAWRKVREKGHKRIGLATNRLLTQRLGGAREGAFAYCQLELDPRDRVPVAEMDEPVSAEAVVAWAKSEKLDALLFGGESTAIETRSLYPELSIYCLDIENRDLGFQGIDTQHEALGIAAIEVLVAQINRGERGAPRHPQNICVKGKWVE